MIQGEIERYCYLSLDYSANIENSSESECNEMKPNDKADEIVEGFLLPSIGLVGIVGNILGIYHFWKKASEDLLCVDVCLSFFRSRIDIIIYIVLQSSISL